MSALEAARSPSSIADAIATLLHFADKPLDIPRACTLLFGLDRPADAVRLAAARARAIDGIARGLHWWKNGSDESDSGGARAFSAVTACYDSAMDPRRGRAWLDALLAQDDELFHITLFQNLIDADRSSELLRLDSPFLENFLANDTRPFVRALLPDLYIARGDHGRAAQQLMASGSGDDLRRAHELARLVGRPDVAARIRSQLRTEHAEGYREDGDAAVALRALPPGADPTRAWKAFLAREGVGEDEIRNIMEGLPRGSTVVEASVVVPCFEDWRFAKWGDDRPTWVPEMLLGVGVSGARVWAAYADLVEGVDGVVDGRRVDQLVLAALWVLRDGHAGNIARMERYVRMAAEREPFGRDVRAILERIAGPDEE
jgi:hypothetical protein